MPVTMVDIGIVRVAVRHALVHVRMRVRLPRVHSSRVFVPVMLVVDVWMLMRQCLVTMLMLVPFREVQPDTCDHQDSRNNQACSHRLAQEH